MIIWKFGGTSVADSERISTLCDIYLSQDPTERPQVIVVSALGGTTDCLLSLAASATQSISFEKQLTELHLRHSETASQLGIATPSFIEESFSELEEILRGVSLLQDLSEKTKATIVSFGERLSAQLVAQAFLSREIPTEYLDARKLIRTDSRYEYARVKHSETKELISSYFLTHPSLQIMTGFIGANDLGDTTTLGRGGSDYSASLLGAALGATSIHIWTDVDGVLSADPRKVADAFLLDQMSYEEAMELSHFGAKVLHPPTIQPARENEIPIYIRNSYNPSCQGTCISKETSGQARPATGLSSISNIALLTLQGSGMIGIPGISRRLFGTLAEQEVSVILISQASSEHSICFAVFPEQVTIAQQAIEREFELEQETGRIDPLVIEEGLSILSLVGENMRQSVGVAASVFEALAAARVNIVAIAQGSSELNISFAIAQKDEGAALRSIHSRFLRQVRSVNLLLAGPGQVGQALLAQIEREAERLKEERGLEIKLVGVMNSSKALTEKNGLSFQSAVQNLRERGTPYSSVEERSRDLLTLPLPHLFFLDTTASDEMDELYARCLNKRIPVITSNKKVQTGSADSYSSLHQLAVKHRSPFLYETSVGAALPLVRTIQMLRQTGDTILKIEGVLSGTLSYLFNHYKPGVEFCELVKQAKQLGYTEPDPREDLGGMDVARKLLILVRESGFLLEMDDIRLEPFIDDTCMQADCIESFFENLKQGSHQLSQKVRAAEEAGEKLHYIASFHEERANIGLQSVSPESPFFSLSGTDNVVAITTKRYIDTPLVIRGAGAGPELTASGVFADLLTAIEERGAF